MFGLAGGTHTYTLRLPESTFKTAAQVGAQRVYTYSNGQSLGLDEFGDEWILCRWYKDENCGVWTRTSSRNGQSHLTPTCVCPRTVGYPRMAGAVSVVRDTLY